jgi:hypothetical protein
LAQDLDAFDGPSQHWKTSEFTKFLDSYAIQNREQTTAFALLNGYFEMMVRAAEQ